MESLTPGNPTAPREKKIDLILPGLDPASS
jgi:hypothetical protein